MSDDTTIAAADTLTATPDDAAVARAKERNFSAAILFALFLHATLLIAAIKAPLRQLGTDEGADKAISVEIVTEKDLQSKTTVPVDPPASPPMPPPQLKGSTAADPVEPRPQQPPATPESQPAFETETLKAEEPDLLRIEGKGEIQPTQKEPAETPKTKSAKADPAAKPAKPVQKRQQIAAREPVKPLDTSIPPSALSGRSASFVRPPGITRSGLNDQFARNVIRALQQTMPQLSGALGRATIRILLDENGNVANIELVNPGKDAKIAQSVVFAARQTSYPIPPGGSNQADRTFLITYIYE